MKYHIHHSTGEHRFEEVEIQPRENAGFVEAESLQEAFVKSQNDINPWNEVHPCRSTSVGDIIQEHDKFYMVCGIGFKLLGEEEFEPTKDDCDENGLCLGEEQT